MDALGGMNWTSWPGRFLSGFSYFWIIGGLAFIGAGFWFEAPRTTFWMIGGIWFVVGLFLRFLGTRMLRSFGRAQQLKATGLPGRATIRSMTQTGLYVNQQPQVELAMQVEVAGRAPYEVTKKEIVPLIALGRLSTGLPLPVRVSPTDPNELMIDWEEEAPVNPGPWYQSAPSPTVPGVTAAGIPATAVSVSGMPGSPSGAQFGGIDVQGSGQMNLDHLKAHLATNGVDGSGVVENVIDTGVQVNSLKLMVIDMNVTIPGKPAYRSNSPSLVAPDKAPRVVKGATLPVTVDPNNPHVLMTEWDRA